MLAVLSLASLIPVLEVFAVLAIIGILIQYLIPVPPNIKTAVLYIIGIVAMVYLVIWALRTLGGSF